MPEDKSSSVAMQRVVDRDAGNAQFLERGQLI